VLIFEAIMYRIQSDGQISKSHFAIESASLLVFGKEKVKLTHYIGRTSRGRTEFM
jgi:hypothetical protein